MFGKMTACVLYACAVASTSYGEKIICHIFDALRDARPAQARAPVAAAVPAQVERVCGVTALREIIHEMLLPALGGVPRAVRKQNRLKPIKQILLRGLDAARVRIHREDGGRAIPLKGEMPIMGGTKKVGARVLLLLQPGFWAITP